DGQGDAWSGANGQRRIKRAPGLGLLCDAKLPAGDEAVCFERQFVEAAENEAMPDVKFRKPVIAARVVGVLNDERFSRREGGVVEGFGKSVGTVELQSPGEMLVDGGPKRIVVGVSCAVYLPAATEIAQGAALCA